MLQADRDRHDANCTNLAQCARAQAGELLEWYSGAGEYCPDCGEELTQRAHARGAVAPTQGAAPAAPLASTLTPQRVAPRPAARSKLTQRLIWLVALIFVASLAVGFAMQRRGVVGRNSPALIAVCTVPIAKQLATDLVSGFAAKSRIPQSHFVFSDGHDCDVRFSTAAETPDAIIASDGIVAIVNPLNPIGRLSEKQLRAIFTGAIRDWAQVGGQRGAIVPILPDAASEEGRLLASSLLYNSTIDGHVLRAPTSAEVTRAVTGASRDSRAAIGFVTFGQAVSAKVLPLSYLPAPSAVSIAARRYPYRLSIAINAEAQRDDPAVIGLIDYAKSSYGAAIVAASGFIPRSGM